MTRGRSTADYLTDLNKWQTRSPEFANTPPKELFEPAFVERYACLHQDLWWRVIRVHGTLKTLDQLSQFPFGFLYAPGSAEFWRLVVANFFDLGIVLLHGLANDKGPGIHGLTSFKDEILKAPWLQADKLDLFKRTLVEQKFSRGVQTIAARAQKIRNSRIAHRLKDEQSGRPLQGLTGVSLSELWQLFDATHSLFGALSFGSAYMTLAGDLIPATVGGKPTRTCLDDVLDSVLRSSSVVNEPEQRAQWWPDARKHTTPEDLRILNELRGRIGLPEA